MTLLRLKGFSALSIRHVSWSKNPRSYCMKLTSEIWSLTSLSPDAVAKAVRPDGAVTLELAQLLR